MFKRIKTMVINVDTYKNLLSNPKLAKFNELLMQKIHRFHSEGWESRQLNLPFSEFGSNIDDVSFLEQTGFNFYKNTSANWWEVYLPVKSEI